MTTDIELRPLPEMDIYALGSGTGLRDVRQIPVGFSQNKMSEYARANVATVTAAKDAEIEALREQLDWTVRQNDGLLNEVREHTARANRMAAALRMIANQGPHYGPDGTYKTWRHWAEIARDALDWEKGIGRWWRRRS